MTRFRAGDRDGPCPEPGLTEARREPTEGRRRNWAVFSLVTFFGQAKKVTRPPGRNPAVQKQQVQRTVSCPTFHTPPHQAQTALAHISIFAITCAHGSEGPMSRSTRIQSISIQTTDQSVYRRDFGQSAQHSAGRAT